MSIDPAELRASARAALSGFGRRANTEKTWPLIVELGWLLVTIPEELGGLGQGPAAPSALYTELGRSLAGASYLSSMLALEAVCHKGFADRQAWAERISSGEMIAAPLSEGAVSLSQGVIDGLQCAVEGGDAASHVLICTPDLVALAPTDSSGMQIEHRATWDETRRLWDVRFAGLRPDPALIIAEGAAARSLAASISMHRDFALAADSVGGAGALLEMTVDHLKTRRQFARPLALFQALKHRCADLETLRAAAEALLLDGLARCKSGAEAANAQILGKMAKHLACAAYIKIAEEAVQLHGGIAMTAEHDCHLYLKRALLNEQLGLSGGAYERDIAASVLER